MDLGFGVGRLCGACLGLLVFSGMILRGLSVGNPVDVILSRALIGLFAGVAIGVTLGRVGAVVVRDNLPEPEPKPEPATVEADVDAAEGDDSAPIDSAELSDVEIVST